MSQPFSCSRYPKRNLLSVVIIIKRDKNCLFVWLTAPTWTIPVGKTGSDDVEWLFQRSVVLFLQNCTTVRLLENMFTKTKRFFAVITMQIILGLNYHIIPRHHSHFCYFKGFIASKIRCLIFSDDLKNLGVKRIMILSTDKLLWIPSLLVDFALNVVAHTSARTGLGFALPGIC